MVDDLYYFGKVLDKKYCYLFIVYNIFMVGLIVIVLLFFIILFVFQFFIFMYDKVVDVCFGEEFNLEQFFSYLQQQVIGFIYINLVK